MPLLQDWSARLVVPGLPEWTGLVLLSGLLLMVLAFLLMPFSVFGVKGRLESLEAQLDELQADLRALALRLPEPRRAAPAEEGWAAPVQPPRREAPPPPRAAPPVPPPAAWPETARRGEPRLDWPRGEAR